MLNSDLKIVSLNCGSSSIKMSVFSLCAGRKNDTLSNIDRILSCKIEEIGTTYGSFYLKDMNKTKVEIEKRNFIDHEEALRFIFKKINLLKNDKNDKEVVIAHRYVHGGKYYVNPLIVGDADFKKLSGLNSLAPLHNPLNLKGLEIIKSLYPAVRQICIFDTAFHAAIPLYAKLYPIPIEYSEKFNIEKYGFHGISYAFILNLLKIYDEKEKVHTKKLIICHLGNGASICAVKNGKSIDTSMGYTPLEGLMMGTRCGNIDPEIPFILKKKINLTDEEAIEILNKKSGLLGISKKTYDFKELLSRRDKYSKLALKMYAYRIVKFIGQYAAVLNGVDAIVFTGGIGENSDELRKEVCRALAYIGVEMDNKKNRAATKFFRSYEPFRKLEVQKSVFLISAITSKVKVYVVHTDEERQMALESIELINSL